MSEDGERAATVRRYVFFDEQRPSRAWMPTLEMINERFSQYMRSALLQHLRPGVEVTPSIAIQLIKHSELIDRLASPTHLTLVTLNPMRGTILVAIDAHLVGWIVESRFGGSGRFPATIAVREFTPFEQNSMRRVVEIVLQQFTLAWKPVAAFEPEIARYETNPPFAMFANSIDLVIISSFEIKVGGGGGKLTIAIPYVLLEPLHERLASHIVEKPPDRDERWSEALKVGIGRASMTLNVELAAIEITVRDFLGLRPGSVFEIDRPDAVTVEASGLPLFRGRWGRHGRKIAVRVEQRLRSVPDVAGPPHLVGGGDDADDER